MRLNWILAVILVLGGVALEAQEEAYAFREPLYLSELDKDLRTPQAVRVGGVVFVAAITGSGETVDEQLRTIYMRAQSLLGNYGMTLADVAQERIYLRSGALYEPKEALRLRFYGANGAPASTVLEVSGLSDSRALVAVEMMAVASPDEE